MLETFLHPVIVTGCIVFSTRQFLMVPPIEQQRLRSNSPRDLGVPKRATGQLMDEIYGRPILD
jgi:hypothetical protein